MVIKKLLSYFAAFMAGFATWTVFGVIEAINPLLPWRYPILIPFTGISFPGGATPGMHYMNHVLETWFPFTLAYFTAYALSNRRADPGGAVAMFIAFLIWSWGMVVLDGLGVPLGTIFAIGLIGTLIGGAGIYFWLVDPNLKTTTMCTPPKL